MIKVWICILFYNWPGGSYSPTVATIDNLAYVTDCHRVGKAWKDNMNNGVLEGAQYRCIQVWKNK